MSERKMQAEEYLCVLSFSGFMSQRGSISGPSLSLPVLVLFLSTALKDTLCHLHSAVLQSMLHHPSTSLSGPFFCTFFYLSLKMHLNGVFRDSGLSHLFTRTLRQPQSFNNRLKQEDAPIAPEIGLRRCMINTQRVARYL